MSDSNANDAAGSVPAPSGEADEKHNQTTHTSPENDAAAKDLSEKEPVDENAEDHVPPASEDNEGLDEEKREHVTEENGSSGADTTGALRESQTAAGGDAADGETEDGSEIVYPNGMQLGFLTLGLCLATFTVALDNSIIGEYP
jgi:hypothetical protein